MKTPPTTERAWKDICLPFFVSYQSVSGTRVGVSPIQRAMGFIMALKSAGLEARVAVQIDQSSFV